MDVFERIVLSLGGQIFSLPRPTFVVGDNHTAATGCNDLIAVKTEARNVPQITHHLPAILCSQTFGSILDDYQVEFPAGLADRVQIYWMSQNMNGKNRFNSTAGGHVIKRAVSHLTFAFKKFHNLVRIHLPVIWLSVYEYWEGP